MWHVLKSIFCTFHARKKKKKKKKVRNPNSLLLTLVEADTLKLYPFKFEEKHFREKKKHKKNEPVSFFFLSYHLHCGTRLPRHQCRGQVLLVLSLRNHRNRYVNDKYMVWGEPNHTQHMPQRKGGKKKVSE